MVINIDIIAKMATNINCSQDRVKSIYKTKDEETRFKRKKQRLCKQEMRYIFV